MKNISGIIFIVAGAALLYWGHNMAQSVGGQLNNLVSGSPGDKPMFCYIGGAILIALGLGQLVWKGK